MQGLPGCHRKAKLANKCIVNQFSDGTSEMDNPLVLFSLSMTLILTRLFDLQNIVAVFLVPVMCKFLATTTGNTGLPNPYASLEDQLHCDLALIHYPTHVRLPVCDWISHLVNHKDLTLTLKSRQKVKR